MFDVGDSVFYPMHGVGIVESIEEKDMLGEKARYYILRFITSKLTAMVPVASADSVGLRPVIDSSECEKIFEYLDAAAVCVPKAKTGTSATGTTWQSSRAATYTTSPTL